MNKFVHLHTHSHYSLLDGLSKIGPLVERAKGLGMEALALTDHGNLYGSVEFYKACKKAGIKPIIGVEAYVTRGVRTSKDSSNSKDTKRYHLILLVKNSVGYHNLTQLVTKSNLEGFYYKPRIDHELIEKYHEGLICLSGCFSGEVMRALEQGDTSGAEEIANYYKGLFGEDYYLEVQPHNLDRNQSIIELGEKLDIPLVATQDSHYLTTDDAPTHEVLLAIQTNNTIDDEGRFSFEGFNSSFRSSEEMIDLMGHIPGAIENTVKIGEKCDFEFDLDTIHLPHFPLPEGEGSNEHLRKLAESGAITRYGEMTDEIRERLDYELSVISKTGFSDYFLIVQDMINWAKNHGIVVGPGRGSAAGSLVSYCLRITDVDPLKYDLLFERFLNPERNEMPDIDIDFADNRRDEVLEYLREKYGEDHVAQIITFGTMAARAAVRDAGRAMGLPYSLCDRVAKLIPFNPNMGKGSIPKYLKETPELRHAYETDTQIKDLLDTASHLEGVARHASVHACGTVVSQKPLVEYLALQRAPQDDNTIITQVDGHGVEDLGLLKIDLLGLRNLTIIEETIKLVRELHGEEIDITKVPLDDKRTYKEFQDAETTGIFQFESAGMRRYLKDLKPTELEDLVAMVSLYRPGPLEMGMVPKYIDRKHGREEVTYFHPKLEPIMKTTYGIGIYQEQMMRIATDLAGFTLPEADTLRKAIGKKIKKLLAEQEEKLVKGMVANGIDQRTAERIWSLYPPFARYGFNRSHAVAYALIAYQTAYLKAHYPVEYMTALFNNSNGDIDRVSYLITEAKRIGIDVLPPDVQSSMSNFVPDDGNIRFGLSTVKNIGEKITDAIVEERLRNGPYETLTGFATRTQEHGLNRKSLESLIKCGALDSLGVERNTALLNMEILLKAASGANAATQANLFGETHEFKLNLQEAPEPATKEEKLLWEKELLGLYVTDNPLTDMMKNGEANGYKKLGEVDQVRANSLVKVCGAISKIQRVTTKAGTPMLFVTLEDMTGNIEILVFSDMLDARATLWEENRIIAVKGKVSKRGGETKLICQDAQAMKT